MVKNLLTPSPERRSTEARRNESASSSLTVDSSGDISVSNADEAPGQYVEWTDKRHSSYLDSLEVSFVKQLHSSLGLLGLRSQMQMTNSSHKMRAHTHHSPEQFTVLRDGCWQGISFQNKQPLVNKIVNSKVSIDSPWISRLISADKHQLSTSGDFQEHVNEGSQSAMNSTSSNDLARNSGKRHASHSSSTAEVSDQNFVDERKVKGSSCTSRAKRVKTDTADSSSSDQIVPNGMFHSREASLSQQLLSQDRYMSGAVLFMRNS